ncbi:precorrin-4/cobalt-precorrin-4 C11-methyltransferase [Actinopolyspora mzabensis]|uniref:Precorrin-4/cobalt-precorrin-4 C11-methyltransferase n=1 Tax=Actinopolyspora mzabensis TaxID=995066 RepID=A0A1G8YT15_ACTMZ|nr:SAM-dependent methyltransferase [Actinopolyspora mzabensis]SDK05584.1 precorrin-4/cobalt-precorrin-4 C11-methyltransferase [Actinopolyspora mzabensis]
MTSGTRTGLVSFVGAGPGAVDLMTLRAARRISEADIVLCSPSTISPEGVREHARADVELLDTTAIDKREVQEIYRRAERERLRVVRLHSGDAAVWSSLQQQYDTCARMELEVEMVPGVAGHTAAAAAVGRELTGAEQEYPLMVARPDGQSNTLPEASKAREFAENGMTMALSVSASRTGQLVERLRTAGYGDDVPVVVAYKVTCSDELVLRSSVGELEGIVKKHRLWRNTLFLVGEALRSQATRARSYSSGRPPGEGTRNGRHAESSSGWRGGSGARYSAGRWGAERSSGTRGASGGSASGPDGPLPQLRSDEQRDGARADADVAWWAVRDWQQNTRDAVRTGGRGGVRHSVVAEQQSAEGSTVPEEDVATEQDAAVAGTGKDEAPTADGSAAPEPVADVEPAPTADELVPGAAGDGASGPEGRERDDVPSASNDSAGAAERETAEEPVASEENPRERPTAEGDEQVGVSSAAATDDVPDPKTEKNGSGADTSAKSGAKRSTTKSGGGRSNTAKSGTRTRSQQKSTTNGNRSGSSSTGSGKRRAAE